MRRRSAIDATARRSNRNNLPLNSHPHLEIAMRIHKLLITSVAVSFAVSGVSSSSRAQNLSIALRGTGSFPTGDFAQTQTTSASGNTAILEGAKSGFGYGLDVGLGIGPIGLYAG